MITVIANLKGGAGKSTVAFNLGVWLARRAQSVVLYDLDIQGTLRDVARVREIEEHLPLLNVQSARHLDQVALRTYPGEVLIDVGSANVEAIMVALEHADRIVIPVQPSQPDVWATQRFLRMVLRHDVHPDGAHLLAFVNRADTHHAVRESDETEAALNQLRSITVLPQRLCNRTIYRRSMSEGLSVFELWPNSKGAEEFVRLAGLLYPDLRDAEDRYS